MIKKIITKVSGVAIIVIASSISFFIANVLIGRFLSKADYGYIQFIRTITFILPIIILTGMDAAFIRYFTESDLKKYDWLRNLTISLKNSIIFSIPIMVFIHFYYNLFWFHSILVLLILVIYSFFLLSNSILRISNQFNKAQILTSGWRIIFLISILIITLCNSVEKKLVIFLYFLSFLMLLLPAFKYLSKLPRGRIKISNLKIFKKSYLFYFITVSGIVMTQLDRFFIGKILGFESLGVFVAVSLVIITVFNLLGTSIGYVLMPYLAKGKKINKNYLIVFVAAISIILFIFFLFFAGRINSILFQGKYDGHRSLILIFCFIGMSQFIYNFIYFSLGGIGKNSDFKKFLLFIIFSIFVFIVSAIILINKFDILGAAIATLISWVIRDLGGVYTILTRKQKINIVK